MILFTSGEVIKELVKKIGSEELGNDLLELIETGLYIHPEEFKEGGKIDATDISR